MIISVIIPSLSTPDSFDLNTKEQAIFLSEAHKGNLESIEKMYLYYKFTVNDFNRSIEMLRLGSKIGDIEYQYRLGRFLIFGRNLSKQTDNKKLLKEGVFWLRKSADNGNKQALEVLKNITASQRPR